VPEFFRKKGDEEGTQEAASEQRAEGRASGTRIEKKEGKHLRSGGEKGKGRNRGYNSINSTPPQEKRLSSPCRGNKWIVIGSEQKG